MAPTAFKTVYLLLAFVALPQVIAGPACASRYHGKPDCIQKCKSRWGYGGHYMGHNKWGPVITSPENQSTDPDSVLSSACGSGTPTAVPGSTPTDPYSNPPSNPSSDPGYIPTPSVPNPEVPPTYTPSSSVPPSPSDPVPTNSTIPSLTPIPSSSPPPPPPPVSPSPPTSSPPPENPSPTSTEEDKPSPTPTSKPSSTSSNLSSGSIKDESLTGHNSFRALHGASPLSWSDDLAAAAKNWASGCVFEHSGGKVGAFGENLAAGTGDYTATDGINAWNDEAKDYDPNNPTYSHFTQVVWKATKEVGCAIVTCPGGSIFAASFGTSQFLACEYYPPGNVIGQFDQNVQA